MKSIPLSNRKYSTLRYLTHELKSTVLGGTQTFIQKYKIVFLEKKKKMFFQNVTPNGTSN